MPETIQVVLDTKLLRAADSAAKRARVNRSAFIREAIREHLKHLRTRELEQREQRGYERFPDNPRVAAEWANEASWPEE